MKPARSFLLSVLVVGVIATAAFSEQPQNLTDHVGELCVRVVGFTSDDGVVKIGLFNSAQRYAARAGSFKKVKLPVKDKMCLWVIDRLPYGEYAVMLYHDENGNDKLDKNIVGVPKEPYGFSNNARANLGLPPYEQVKFLFDTEATTLDIWIQ